MANLYKQDVDKWLEELLKDTPKPDVPTLEVLETVKEAALNAKIANVEEYNMSVSSRMRRRVPENLSELDVAAILLHLFTFRKIKMSNASDGELLTVYVPGSTDIWKLVTTRNGTAEGIYTSSTTLLEYLPTRLTIHKTREIEEVLSMVARYAPIVETTNDSHLFPVNNGVFNQKTGILESFTPDYVFMSKIGIDYKKGLTNPVIQNPDGTQWDVESGLRELAVSDDVNALFWQVIAASLQPNRGMNKSIWFYSESGNNGKGTIGQLIKNLLGIGNYASLSVVDFKHEFHKQALIGVAANIADENDVDEYIDSVKDYKASITGDDILINRKHKDPIRLQFRGLNIQMMNGLPKTKDKTGSFYRRIIIVPFTKSFTNNGERTYIKDDYIGRRDVLEYVLSKALSLQFDEFIVPMESAMVLDQYKEKNNPVLNFWNEIKEELKWDLVPSKFLYDLYRKWFERTNPSGKVIGQGVFYEHLSPIIDSDGEWENRIGSDKSNVRTGTKMDADEPLITEYGLDKDEKNGSPSPWVNQSYTGNNNSMKRDFARKNAYKGILRN